MAFVVQQWFYDPTGVSHPNILQETYGPFFSREEANEVAAKMDAGNLNSNFKVYELKPPPPFPGFPGVLSLKREAANKVPTQPQRPEYMQRLKDAIVAKMAADRKCIGWMDDDCTEEIRLRPAEISVLKTAGFVVQVDVRDGTHSIEWE